MARGLIAQWLGVPPGSFEVEIERKPEALGPTRLTRRRANRPLAEGRLAVRPAMAAHYTPHRGANPNHLLRRRCALRDGARGRLHPATPAALGHMSERLHRVMAECPLTGECVFTGLRLDRAALDAASDALRMFECSGCGRAHEWRIEDAMAEDVDERLA